MPVPQYSGWATVPCSRPWLAESCSAAMLCLGTGRTVEVGNPIKREPTYPSFRAKHVAATQLLSADTHPTMPA